MRKKVTLMTTVALLGGALSCQGMPAPPDVPSPPRCGASEGPERGEGFPPHLARALDLTEAQQKQMATLFGEQREKDQAMRKKERELREHLRGVEEAVPFNEAAVKGAAQKLAALEVERVVARAKSRARIEALLTPAQRTLAEKLRPRREDARPPFPCGCGPRDAGERAPFDEPERR